MTTTFSGFRQTTISGPVPVMLTYQDGMGARHGLLEATFGASYQERQDLKVITIDLSKLTQADLTFPAYSEGVVYTKSWIEEKFGELKALSGPADHLVVFFDVGVAVDQGVALEVIKRVTQNNDLPAAMKTVFTGQEVPPFLLQTPSLLKKFQVLEWDCPTIYPVLTMPHHEVTPLSEYRSMAVSLVDNRTQLSPEARQEKVKTLGLFLDALDGLEGGVYGLNAYERGMDTRIIQGLNVFSKVHEQSVEHGFASLAERIRTTFATPEMMGNIVEREVGMLGLEPKRPNQGLRENDCPIFGD